MDVSNTVFWHETVVSQLALLMAKSDDMYGLERDCMPQSAASSFSPDAKKESPIFHMLKKLQKNEVNVRFRGAADSKCFYPVLRFQ